MNLEFVSPEEAAKWPEGTWVRAEVAAISPGEVFEFRLRPGAPYVFIRGAMLSLDRDGGLPMLAYLTNAESEIRFTGERAVFGFARLPDTLPEVERND